MIGDFMIYAITAINWDEIEDLLRHGLKTFELVAADHIQIARKLKPKSRIFIGNMSKQDVVRGVEGVLAEVKSVKVDYWRIAPQEFDEKEVLTARIQVRYIDHAKVSKVENLGMGKGLKVDYETHVLLG